MLVRQDSVKTLLRLRQCCTGGRHLPKPGPGRAGLVLRQLRSAKRRYRAIAVETRSTSMTAVVKTDGPILDGELQVGAAKEVHDMNWKQRVLEAAAGIVLIALPVHAQQVGPTDRDERIVSFIHQANLHEIAAANLAKAKSSSQDVKDFADQMFTDHQSADEQLRSYAQAHKIDLDGLRRHLTDVDNQRLEDERESKALGTATGEWAFTWENANVARRENAKTLARLRSLDGAAFDREFASDMVQGHQRVVDRLVDARDRGIDPDLRKLIDSLLPTVKHHLEMAQALQGVVAKA